VAWSPDCSLLAASSAGGAVYLFDYAKGIALKKWQLHGKPSLRVSMRRHEVAQGSITKPNLLLSRCSNYYICEAVAACSFALSGARPALVLSCCLGVAGEWALGLADSWVAPLLAFLC
jgi:hypothetical protein